MDVFTAITERSSVRAYKEAAVEEEKVTKVLEAARLAPSASNRQEWKFVVVRKEDLRARVADAAFGQSFLAEAPVIIAACATEAKAVMSCGQPAHTVDLSIAGAFMLLEAYELGLGTCWIGAFNEGEVKKILNVPAHARVVALIPLGYPNQPPSKKLRKKLDQIVSHDTYK
jgi:nitroreductase